MGRKIYWLVDSNLVKTTYSESSVNVSLNMSDFVSSLEFKYEIVGIYFEKQKIGFILREIQ